MKPPTSPTPPRSPRRRKFAGAALALALLGTLPTTLRAQDDPAGDLPKPLPKDSFEAVLTSSPFTRSLNLSDSLLLSGMATIDGKPVATIFNKDTRETFVVGTEAGPNGWKLTELDVRGEGLEKSQAKIDVGGQVVTIRFDGEELSHEKLKGGRPGGVPDAGQGQRPGDSRKRGPGYRPDPELMKRFYSLSDAAREKFREKMMQLRESGKDMSPEDRMSMFRKTVEALEREDKAKK